MNIYFEYTSEYEQSNTDSIQTIDNNKKSILKRITRSCFNIITYQILGELILTLILFVMLIWTSVAGTDINIQPVEFQERDPALSAPLYDSTVSFMGLVLITIVGPIILFIIGETIKCWNIGLKQSMSKFAYLALAYTQCISLAGTITNIIKLVVRRPRPNFFMLCDYMDIRTNVSFYLANTIPGAFGRYSNCFAESSDIIQAALSFPSGHSSFSFCSMLFIALYIRRWLQLEEGRYLTIFSAIAASPLILSTWVAITRVRNRWHNYDDISVGAVIGILCALITWYNYVLSGRDNPPPKKNNLERNNNQELSF